MEIVPEYAALENELLATPQAKEGVTVKDLIPTEPLFPVRPSPKSDLLPMEKLLLPACPGLLSARSHGYIRKCTQN